MLLIIADHWFRKTAYTRNFIIAKITCPHFSPFLTISRQPVKRAEFIRSNPRVHRWKNTACRCLEDLPKALQCGGAVFRGQEAGFQDSRLGKRRKRSSEWELEKLGWKGRGRGQGKPGWHSGTSTSSPPKSRTFYSWNSSPPQPHLNIPWLPLKPHQVEVIYTVEHQNRKDSLSGSPGLCWSREAPTVSGTGSGGALLLTRRSFLGGFGGGFRWDQDF